jgi:peptidoglycan-associated lipoprotein
MRFSEFEIRNSCLAGRQAKSKFETSQSINMRNTILLSFLFLFFYSLTNGQPINRATPQDMLDIANKKLAEKDYYTALEWFEKYAEEVEDTDLEIDYQMAELEFLLRDFRQAERQYARILRKIDRLRERKKRKPQTVVPDFPDLRFKYARVLKMNEKYDQAVEEFSKYIGEEAEDPQMVRMAKMEITGAEMAKVAADIPGLEVENMDEGINTPFTEYGAFIAPDGSEMYYSSFSREDVIELDGKEGDYHSKVYMASLNGEEWGGGTVMNEKINRENYHTGNSALSQDGNVMYFTRSKLEGNELGSSVIYYSRRGAQGWTGAMEIKGLDTSYINRHPMPGELYGKEVLFFVSDRDGGFGGSDIYYAPIKGEGEVGEAVNLGKGINTPGDEVTPYYQEGILYFSSTGYPGFGGLDVFESTWDGTSWSKPENLGKGINSSVDDWYFTVDLSGLKGFLVSNRPSRNSLKGRTCCDDIYYFTRPEIIAALRAEVYDMKTKNPLPGGTLELIDLTDDRNELVDTRTNENGHKFEFGLELDKAYSVRASREGYYPDTFQLNTLDLIESTNYDHQFRLLPMPPPEPKYDTITVTINEPIRLNNIYYDYADDKILPDAEEDLQGLLDLLNQYEDMIIELSSHTDARGNDDYNMGLSQRRANSAKNWLTKRGIPSERIKAVGYGESQILNECTNDVECDEDQHRFNRRTEFKIIEGPTSIMIKQTKVEKVEEEKD